MRMRERMEQINSTNSPGSPVIRATTSAQGLAGCSPAAGRAALIIGHPGHELCVYGWCRLSKPFVFILTDGSGRTELSRTPRSLWILNQLGCTTDSESGKLRDRDIYEALLDQNHQLFIGLARKIAQALVLHDVDRVVGDAGEGFNPVHDVCRLIIDAAVEIAGSALNRRILNFGFRLDWRREIERRAEPDYATTLSLDQEDFASKLAAARGYTELAPEVDSALNNNGAEAFRL